MTMSGLHEKTKNANVTFKKGYNEIAKSHVNTALTCESYESDQRSRNIFLQEKFRMLRITLHLAPKPLPYLSLHTYFVYTYPNSLIWNACCCCSTRL
jgi:hypothetical protein